MRARKQVKTKLCNKVIAKWSQSHDEIKLSKKDVHINSSRNLDRK